MRETGIISAKSANHAVIEMEQAVAYHGIIALISEGEPHVTIMDISGLKHISKEARHFLSKKSSEWGKTIAVAFVTNSFRARTIASFFLTVNRPSYPVKVFKDQSEAYQWARNEYHRFSTKIAS